MADITFGGNSIENAHFGGKELRQIVYNGSQLWKASARITAITFSLSNSFNSFGGAAGSITIEGTPGAQFSISGTNGANGHPTYSIPADGSPLIWAGPTVASNQGSARTPTWTVIPQGDSIIDDGIVDSHSVNQSAALTNPASISGGSFGSLPFGTTFSYSNAPAGSTLSIGGCPATVINGTVRSSIGISGSGSQSVSCTVFCNASCSQSSAISATIGSPGYTSVSVTRSGSTSYACFDFGCAQCGGNCQFCGPQWGC